MSDFEDRLIDDTITENEHIDTEEEAQDFLEATGQLGDGGGGGLIGGASDFLQSPREHVITWVAAWAIGMVMSVFAWFYGIAFDIVETFLIVPQTLTDAVETLIETVGTLLTESFIGALEDGFVAAVGGAGPFGFVLGALFITTFLYGVWIAVQAISRVFRRVVV